MSCYHTEATVEQSTLLYPNELLHGLSKAPAVCHALRALQRCRLQPMRQAYRVTQSRDRSSSSTSHLLVLPLLIWIHKVIIILLIVVTPAGLRIVLQLLLYFAIIGCFTCLTTCAFIENIAEVKFFVLEVFIVAFFFWCALDAGISGGLVRRGAAVCLLRVEGRLGAKGTAYVFRSRLFFVFVIIVHHHVIMAGNCFSLAFDLVGHLVVARDG